MIDYFRSIQLKSQQVYWIIEKCQKGRKKETITLIEKKIKFYYKKDLTIKILFFYIKNIKIIKFIIHS